MMRPIYPPPPQPDVDTNVFGDPQQEIDIFVIPRQILSANIKLDKTKVAPGDTVGYTITLNSC